MAALCGHAFQNPAAIKSVLLPSIPLGPSSATFDVDDRAYGFCAQVRCRPQAGEEFAQDVSDYAVVVMVGRAWNGDGLQDIATSLASGEQDLAHWIGAPGGIATVAMWVRHEKTLWLARSAFCPTAIHYRQDGDSFTFSSIAPGIALGDIDLSHVAARFADPLAARDNGTGFCGVHRLRPGELLRWTGAAAQCRRLWSTSAFAACIADDAPDRIRSAMEVAVGDAVRGSRTIATQLSAGRDSGAVTALAATIAATRDRSLDAYTAVPGNTEREVVGNRIVDEGPLASRVAGKGGGIDHHLVPSREWSLGELMVTHNRLLASPHETPINLGWWCDLLDRARQDGHHQMLSGTLGNFTISAGGPWALADLLRAGSLLEWWRTARKAARHSRASWLNLLSVSFGPFLRPTAYRALLWATGRLAPSRSKFLKGELKRHVEAMERDRDHRPPRTYDDDRRATLDSADEFDPNPEAIHDLVIVDPCADQRVVEASLTLSPADLAAPYDERPGYEAAFRDLVPPTTLRPPGFGLQASDWNQRCNRTDLARTIEGLAQSPLASANIDLQALQSALANWPSEPLTEGHLYHVYTDAFMRSLSIGIWLSLHEPSRRAEAQ